MKEVVLDTETTGLSVKDGHRIVEIGCIELENLVPTQNKFHYYLNTAQTLGNDTLERQPLYLNDVFHPHSPLL